MTPDKRLEKKLYLNLNSRQLHFMNNTFLDNIFLKLEIVITFKKGHYWSRFSQKPVCLCQVERDLREFSVCHNFGSPARMQVRRPLAMFPESQKLAAATWETGDGGKGHSMVTAVLKWALLRDMWLLQKMVFTEAHTSTNSRRERTLSLPPSKSNVNTYHWWDL